MQDFYGGEDANSAAPDSPESPATPDDQAEDSALIPKSIVPKDAKPGDVCSFKIVHMYEDEAEIQYVKKDDEEKGEEHPVDRMARESGMEE